MNRLALDAVMQNFRNEMYRTKFMKKAPPPTYMAGRREGRIETKIEVIMMMYKRKVIL